MVEEIVRGLMSNGLWATLIAVAASFVLLRLLGLERADRLARDAKEEERSLRRYDQYERMIGTMQAISSGQAVIQRQNEEAAGKIEELCKQVERLLRRPAR